MSNVENIIWARLAKDAGVSVEKIKEIADQLVLQPAPRKGRKSAYAKHMAIMRSIEALRSLPLTLDEAVSEAANGWCLSTTHIEDIYAERKLTESADDVPILERMMGAEQTETASGLRAKYKAMGVTLEGIRAGMEIARTRRA